MKIVIPDRIELDESSQKKLDNLPGIWILSLGGISRKNRPSISILKSFLPCHLATIRIAYIPNFETEKILEFFQLKLLVNLWS